MYLRIEVNNNIKIDYIAVAAITTLRQLLADSAGHFWRPEKFEDLESPYFGNPKHLQNLGIFFWLYLV